MKNIENLSISHETLWSILKFGFKSLNSFGNLQNNHWIGNRIDLNLLQFGENDTRKIDISFPREGQNSH